MYSNIRLGNSKNSDVEQRKRNYCYRKYVQKSRKDVKTAFGSNCKKYSDSKFLNLDIERLEKRYYVNKSEKITIDEVIARLSHIF